MLTNTLINAAAIPSLPHFPITTPSKPLKSPPLCCFRKNANVSGVSRQPSKMESGGHDKSEMSQAQEKLRTSNDDQDIRHNDVWRLFKEAQQNILYLNKQRLQALEELNRANSEKELLLDKIRQLEAERQGGVGKDKQSLCWELLLRIDSMVLTGLVNTGEASDLRKLVLDHEVSVADVFDDILQKNDAELLAEFYHFSSRSKKGGFHIIHICTEMEPLVSVGSLASYITGLCYALQRKGHLVEVILPKILSDRCYTEQLKSHPYSVCRYANMDLDRVQGLREIEAEAYSYFNGQLHGNRIWTGVVYGIGVTFIQPSDFSSFFSRERVYGYPDDFERFTYFSRASLDYIVKSGKKPDVLHIHNWETAIVGPLFWDIFVNQGLGGTKILLTCHSLDSQCLEHPDKLALCGLDPLRLHRPDRLQDNSKTHLINILKGGVVYSNKVVIMSSMHSKGGIIRSFGEGLDSTLSVHQNKLLVAPCGFDNSTWDPSKDRFLPENYCAEDMKGKTACKAALQLQLGLFKHVSTILVGCMFSDVSDVLENLKAVVQDATMRGTQFIFMGTNKRPSVNRALISFQEELKDGNVRFIDSYDDAVAHLIFAASDIILCQSFHDPVLQVPLKALRYGAAPIAIASNNIIFRHFQDLEHEMTKFAQYITSSFGKMSLNHALDEIKNSPSTWKRKIMDAMSQDFSWDAECCDIHVSAYTALKKL